MVIYVWNVTTGEEYALKEPLEKLRKKYKLNIKAWRKKANILKCISHVSSEHHIRAFLIDIPNCLSIQDHIIMFKNVSFFLWPQSYFEYLPKDSLNIYLSSSTFHNKQVVTQLLSALTYLHGCQPQIVHENIKPQNILILSWAPDGVYVKFADFGLLKQADYLNTFCGTAAVRRQDSTSSPGTCILSWAER